MTAGRSKTFVVSSSMRTSVFWMVQHARSHRVRHPPEREVNGVSSVGPGKPMPRSTVRAFTSVPAAGSEHIYHGSSHLIVYVRRIDPVALTYRTYDADYPW